ncbi:PilZ domain-containing protein [Paraconexibacter sp.]|uniref:PilZ domain-containing protein n=1 Tax=Paraconexibacter sp. TaxID=2949640 RepID=UPI003564C49A
MRPWERTVTAHEQVRLDVAGIGSFETVVLRAVAGAAELAILSGPVPARYLAGRPCVARAASDGTGARVEGRLVRSLDALGRLRDDAVQIVFAAARSTEVPPAAPRGVTGVAAYTAVHPHAPETQRRAFQRVAVVRPVTLVPERFRVGWLDGRTRDLSVGGTLVSGAERLREGERLRLVLELGPGTLFDTRGRVTRIDEAGLAGVHWERLSADERRRLALYVTRRQRAALAELRARA